MSRANRSSRWEQCGDLRSQRDDLPEGACLCHGAALGPDQRQADGSPRGQAAHPGQPAPIGGVHLAQGGQEAGDVLVRAGVAEGFELSPERQRLACSLAAAFL